MTHCEVVVWEIGESVVDVFATLAGEEFKVVRRNAKILSASGGPGRGRISTEHTLQICCCCSNFVHDSDILTRQQQTWRRKLSLALDRRHGFSDGAEYFDGASTPLALWHAKEMDLSHWLDLHHDNWDLDLLAIVRSGVDPPSL